MPTPDASLELERFLPYRLSVLSNIVSARIARAYQDQFGLTIPEWRIIAVLARYPGLSANDVAERTAMDKVMVSRAVAGLLKDARVVRRSAAHDRRFSTLSLTAKGRAIFAKVAPVARGIEGQLLSSLAPEEFQALDGLLAKLTEAATALN
jgi:DNA-binding MarR family transcriptional regulator